MSILESRLVVSTITIFLTYLCNAYKDWENRKQKRLNLLNSLFSEVVAL